jgi:hypothetical protein
MFYVLIRSDEKDDLDGTARVCKLDALRFSDLRLKEVRRVLRSNRPVVVRLENIDRIPDHELAKQQQKQLARLADRIVALPIGIFFYCAVHVAVYEIWALVLAPYRTNLRSSKSFYFRQNLAVSSARGSILKSLSNCRVQYFFALNYNEMIAMKSFTIVELFLCELLRNPRVAISTSAYLTIRLSLLNFLSI